LKTTKATLLKTDPQYAKTIHSCGDDLIQLINDILDLSKIESGYISADFINVRFNEITYHLWKQHSNTFPKARASSSASRTGTGLPDIIETDVQRLNQILKNLLSNAFKFTEKGEVKLRIFESHRNWITQPKSRQSKEGGGIRDLDTGIGIQKDKQNIIFEAFQQAEGSTSRKYGGTGLGLSISRGLADLLGGTIELESEVGTGSSFTLYLPIDYNPKLMKKEKQSSSCNQRI
jgi:signal transduction histidine kinase